MGTTPDCLSTVLLFLCVFSVCWFLPDVNSIHLEFRLKLASETSFRCLAFIFDSEVSFIKCKRYKLNHFLRSRCSYVVSVLLFRNYQFSFRARVWIANAYSMIRFEIERQIINVKVHWIGYALHNQHILYPLIELISFDIEWSEPCSIMAAWMRPIK